MVILFPIKCRHYLEVADLLESVLFPGSHQLYSNPQFSYTSGENRGRKPSAGKGPRSVCVWALAYGCARVRVCLRVHVGVCLRVWLPSTEGPSVLGTLQGTSCL